MAGRVGAATLWTRRELLVWGGGGREGHLADGASYDPEAGSWRVLAPAPIGARGGHAWAWTGRDMLIWGGGDRERLNDGAAYSPAGNRWDVLPPSPLRARSTVSVAWTGDVLVLWGGEVGAGDPLELASDGARFSP